jgi:hypothetical protein
MSNPSGDYKFEGLGFTGLRFFPDGKHYIGYLYYGEDSSIAISEATYTDATGSVTFKAGTSPAGVSGLHFTGKIALGRGGNVIAIKGTWTGRSSVHAPGAAATAESASDQTKPGIPIAEAHGTWEALDRQDIIP